MRRSWDWDGLVLPKGNAYLNLWVCGLFAQNEQPLVPPSQDLKALSAEITPPRMQANGSAAAVRAFLQGISGT
jgi:hypothetical protein